MLNKMRLLPPSENTPAQFAQLLAGALALIQWCSRRSWCSTMSRASVALTASTRSHWRGVAKGLSARVSCDEPSELLVSVPEQQPNPARPASRETCIDVRCAGTKMSDSYQA
jgi:hypothetical protein